MYRNRIELTLRTLTLPFSSSLFYENDFIEKLFLENTVKGYQDAFQKGIFRIYSFLNQHGNISDLDEIDLYFEKSYSFYNLKEYKYISDFYLKQLTLFSKSFISHRNGNFTFKYWNTECDEKFLGPYNDTDKVVIWNYLNRMMTTDLIIIQYLIENNIKDLKVLERYNGSLFLEDSQLEKILEKGVAETHLHLGAGTVFDISWRQLMNNVDKHSNIYNEKVLNNFIFNDCRITVELLKSTAITRIILSEFLEDYKDLNNFDCFVEDRKYNTNVLKILKSIYEGNSLRLSSNEYSDIWNDITHKYYNFLTDSETQDIYITHIAKDIIVNIFNCEKNYDLGEKIFLYKSLEYINKHSDDKYFSKLFWQYIRVKNELFRLKVQEGQIKGLKHFQQYYNRSTEIDVLDDTEYWEFIISNQLKNPALKKLELRISIKGKSEAQKIKNLKLKIKCFFKAYLNILNKRMDSKIHTLADSPSIGIIIHMIKKEDEKSPERCFNTICEENLNFYKIQKDYLKEINAIKSLRESIPFLSNYILGIDAASIEHNTPPWVFAPIFEQARDSSDSNFLCTETVVRSLGFTFHVGEEFRHLLTGLRHIDEVLERFKFHAGDRIGHGIAIGLDVKKWVDKNRVILLPREEYIDNLLWLWGMGKDLAIRSQLDLSHLERLILEQAEEVYGNVDGISVYLLWKVYRRKFNLIDSKIKDYCQMKKKSHCVLNYEKQKSVCWNENSLMAAQHCKLYLMRLKAPIHVKIAEEDIKLLEFIQILMREKVCKKGIVIETNPSSNSVIGEMDDIFDHYIHHLNSIDKSANKLIVSINTDDPCIFNTNIRNEYAYVFYSLLDKGISRENALDWIEKVRQYSLNSSFIPDLNMNISERIEQIEFILGELDK